MDCSQERGRPECNDTLMNIKKIRTVLIVDDDRNVVAMLKQALTHIGCLVLSAGDGMEALARHEHQSDAIDLLITDLQMPYMNGHELAERLLQQRPNLPIVFISGDPEAETVPAELTSANLSIMRKPFAPSELIARVTSLFAT